MEASCAMLAGRLRGSSEMAGIATALTEFVRLPLESNADETDRTSKSEVTVNRSEEMPIYWMRGNFDYSSALQLLLRQ